MTPPRPLPNGVAHHETPDHEPGLDPTVAAMLDLLKAQDKRAADRDQRSHDALREQTTAFTGALERQTDRIGLGQRAQTRTILAIALVAMLLAAGRDFVLTGLGFDLRTSVPVAATQAAP